MRIAGITLPDNKKLEIALTSIYGIGRSRSLNILKKTNIDPGMKPSELTPDQENDIRKVIENFKVEGDLKREISGNIKRLKDIKAYRGVRHLRKLPVKGQRTKTNSRTVRGNTRKTMGSGRKSVDKK